MDALKTFATLVTSSKVNTRVQITGDLLPVLARPNLPEPALKAVVRCLTLTLARYHDAKSRRAVREVIRVLAENHAALMIKALPLALKDILVYIKIPVANSSVAKVSLQALSWTCVVLKMAVKEAKLPWSELKHLMLTLAQLVDGLCTAHCDFIIKAGYKKVNAVFRDLPGSVHEFCHVLNEDIQVTNVCMVSFCLRHFMAKDDQDKYKDKFLELYVKTVLTSKTKPRIHVLKHSQEILRLVSHDDFQQNLLPTLQKMMLRNPEVVIECVGYLLRNVNIDLSQYSGDIIRSLAAQLHANSEDVQKEALVAVESLACQISDVGAAEGVVRHLFNVLSGSEGKLTVVSQKQTVLNALGKLACCKLANKSAAQDLASSVTESFAVYLNSEAHEGTLVTALENMAVWCAKFTTDVPPKLLQLYKSGPALKTSTSAVRQMYYHCMAVTFSGDTLLECKDLVPSFIAVVEKAYGQATQLGPVAEAALVSVILARLACVDVDSDSKLSGFWNLVLEKKKIVLLADKFLTSAPENALKALISLAEVLILTHPDRLDRSGSASLWYRLVCFCLASCEYKIRWHATNAVRKILSTLCGGKLAVLFLEQFAFLLNEQKFEAHSVTENGDHIGHSPKNLCHALLSLCSIKHIDKSDANAVACASLVVAHHPSLLSHDRDLWCRILSKINVDAATFTKTNVEKILNALTEEEVPSRSCLLAVETVARVGGFEIIDQLVQSSIEIMKKNEISTVTLDEFHIMKIPEGELFDKSVIDTSQKVDDTHNLKRESKLYSYDDQLEELRYRKEQEAKRIARGEVIAPKLTKKQQEMKDAQLKRESGIRKRLLELDIKLNASCKIISAVFKGNPHDASQQILVLMRAIVPILKSPLAAPKVTDLVVQFAEVIFESTPDLGLLIAYSTMRSLSACCELNKWWCQEPSIEQMLRAVKLFHQFSEKTNLDTSQFTMAFYLIRFELKTKTTDKDIPVNLLALETISAYAKLKSDDERSGPYLLPRLELMELLLNVIGTRSGKVMHGAFDSLMLVTHAASGEEGCAVAEQQEVDVCLKYLLSPVMSVREACLGCLRKMVAVLALPDDMPLEGARLRQRLFVAKFDTEESVALLAEKLWNDLCLDVDPSLGPLLIDDCVHHEDVIRIAVCDALGHLLKTHNDIVPIIIPLITEKYEEKLYQPPPVLDNFGRIISESPPDEWPARCGLALALGKLSSALTGDQIEDLFNFFVTHGLNDRHEQVRKAMLDAALEVITEHGKEHVGKLLPVFEQFLVDTPATATFDAVRQSVVILMGSLAKHLEKDDPKVKPIIGKLVETLGTPSQQVQEAVANCLPPLVPAISEEAPIYLQDMLQLLLESERYAERKGAAYGVAGIVKGLGILSLKKHGIMAMLQEAVQDKKNPKRREGALFAYEMLCQMLGRLFEPYVVNILPHLLLCFGDNNQYVREAADDTAKALMSKLSAHGVKLVLPSLLRGLEEDSWRTKTGSVELLGAMAFCAPKQLSACLPSIVPKLGEVLNDSHAKVQKAGSQALRQIGSVIKNPEIQEIVHVLLDALQEPTKQTTPCLQTLLETKFVHFIDAPSLALIMPVVQRAFQDRSTETRKMAAQIIGNIYSLTDQKDLSPYLPAIIPGLKQSLLDPVPEVRSVSSRALGAMVRGMGESSFEELLPWLMKTLTTEGSSVDRSGAAQGLAEVMGAMGVEKLKKHMPDIIETAERIDIPPHVRDGYIMMYIYLPAVFTTDFMPWVGPILPSILKALADECEYVRDTALKAGQRIINMFAETAITLLLPELERGLFDDNWRIRYSSVQLLGDLLYRLSGVTGKMSTESRDDDDNFGTELSQTAIMNSLGNDRRNRVLAGLYMGRSDTSLMVRQASLHVWKVIVPNTPRTLRELLPTLFQLLLGCLASTSYDKRQVAAKTLGDIVRKLGERVLPEIIPILESGLESDQSDQRQGVCIGLSEIMSSTSRDHVMVFADSLIPTVRKALIDPLPQVRQAAAQTFDNLHANIGIRAMEEILPYLLEKLSADDPEVSDRALDGLQQVMAVKSRVVLPFMVPQLTNSQPVNSRALAILSSVAGDSLSHHLNKILPAMLHALADKVGRDGEQEEIEYCKSVVLSITDENGVNSVLNELLSVSGSGSDDRMAYAAVTMLNAFCSNTKFDYSDYVPQLIRSTIFIFTRSDENLLSAAWECLNSIVKKMDATEMLHHIANVRQAVRFALMDFKEENLPGFCLPKKGIAPVLAIFREGLLNGPPEMKEAAANGLAEVIRCTSADALKVSVVNMTGPLIRILGDRFSHTVKVAVLETLGLLLGKCSVMLKPFLPQLQTTFIKALHDPNRVVRLKAGSCLGKLTVIHIRVDPLFVELHTSIKNESEDPSVRDCMIQALRLCIESAGNKMGEGTKRQILPTLMQYLSAGDDNARMCGSACLGALAPNLAQEEMKNLFHDHLLDGGNVDWTIKHGRCIALQTTLYLSADTVLVTWESSVRDTIVRFLGSDRTPVVIGGLKCYGYYARSHLSHSKPLNDDVSKAAVKCMRNDSNDVKIALAQTLNYVTSNSPTADITTLKMWISALVNLTKEKNTMVRTQSEFALIRLLELDIEPNGSQEKIAALDPGMREAAQDVVNKTLMKILHQTEKINDIDDTLLK